MKGDKYMLKENTLRAFTLSEILITLAIIGVVAALTIPNLIQQYKKTYVETRLKRFYSLSNQAVALSEIENGPAEQWETWMVENGTLTSKEWWEKYFAKYIKTVKVEYFNSSNRERIAVYLQDGSFMLISDGYDIFYYPNAKDFNPDDLYTGRGTKMFSFSFNPATSILGDVPLNGNNTLKANAIDAYRQYYTTIETDENGNQQVVIHSDLSHEALLNDPRYGCKASQYKGYCTALIAENGWKIPDDYPFKF